MPIISIGEIQRVTPFLKLVLQRLREDEQSITTPRWPLEDSLSTESQISGAHVTSIDPVEGKKENEDEESDSDGKLPFIFDDDTGSVHSCNSENTRFSDYQAIPMDEDGNGHEDEIELASRTYSFTDLHDLLCKIATRLPESMFDDLIRHTQLVMGEQNMVFFHTLTSHRCPKSGKEHSYYSPHRCFRCDTQLCKECENCILDHCEKVSVLETNKYPRKDSLAARRVLTWCNCPSCASKGPRSLHICQCSEFLQSPTHSCDTSRFHMCPPCFDFALRGLVEENTQTITLKKESHDEDDEVTVEYIVYCITGAEKTECTGSANGSCPRMCKICWGRCKPYRLNDVGARFASHFNGGNEGSVAEWNNGTCPYFLK